MLHQRGPLGLVSRRIGLGDEPGAAEIEGRLSGMPGVGPGLAVDGDVLLVYPHILVPRRQEQTVAGLAGCWEFFDASRRETDFRRRFLHRVRRDRDILDVVKLALVGEIVLLPGAL